MHTGAQRISVQTTGIAFLAVMEMASARQMSSSTNRVTRMDQAPHRASIRIRNSM